MKGFIIKSSRSVGIMAILGFVLLFAVNSEVLERILPDSAFGIIFSMIFLGIIWSLVGIFLSNRNKEKTPPSPEALRTQHTVLAIVFLVIGIGTLISGALIPAIILLIGAGAEWFNR